MISATADDGCKKLFSVYIQFVYFVSLRLGTYNTLHPAKAAGFAGGWCPLSTDTKVHRKGLNSKNMSVSRCSSHPGVKNLGHPVLAGVWFLPETKGFCRKDFENWHTKYYTKIKSLLHVITLAYYVLLCFWLLHYFCITIKHYCKPIIIIYYQLLISTSLLHPYCILIASLLYHYNNWLSHKWNHYHKLCNEYISLLQRGLLSPITAHFRPHNLQRLSAK